MVFKHVFMIVLVYTWNNNQGSKSRKHFYIKDFRKEYYLQTVLCVYSQTGFRRRVPTWRRESLPERPTRKPELPSSRVPLLPSLFVFLGCFPAFSLRRLLTLIFLFLKSVAGIVLRCAFPVFGPELVSILAGLRGRPLLVSSHPPLFRPREFF